MKLPHKNNYPGEQYYYVLCDVCGSKIRAKDAILITDKYSNLNNLLVCKDDADITNPQESYRIKKEAKLPHPSIMRSEGTDKFVFIDSSAQIESGDSSDPTGRVPEAPTNLTALSATAPIVELIWQGPNDPGSSGISGYVIERESPVGGGFSTLSANTLSVAGYYKDSTVSSSTVYNYRVSAINRSGSSSPSNNFTVTT